MQAEIPQPISGVPLRWGGFTGRQLGWLGTGTALPYLLLRLQLSPELALAASAPWLAAATLFAFGRREGRRLDCWVGDWLWFKLQPHHLRHPGTSPVDRYVTVDCEGHSVGADAPLRDAALPWVAP
ncbi:MAG TPA: PrgI family protein [Candidatus Dormibacteraeota bacterium]|nr:PrgI family protein [Candidatus Dormibacteraeota bacterium]